MVKVSSNLADLPLDLLAELHPYNGHLVVKMSSNLADLPLWLWHLTVKMSSNLADLPLDQLADLPPGTDILWSRWFQDLADVILNLLGRSNPLVLTSQDQGDFKFGRSIPKSVGRSTPPVLTSCGQDEFIFADLPLDQLTDPPCQYWHLMVKMISNWQIYPPGTDISQSRWVQIWQIYP